MPRLAVAHTEGKGRGVFTLEPIAKGEAVVTDSVIVVPTKQLEKMGPPLVYYPFVWDEGHSCIALGLVSLANHAGDNPACYVERDLNKLTIRLVAKRDIVRGEEICYDYKVPLWFEPQPPARLNLSPLLEPESRVNPKET